ncbi:MAG: DUF6382 domain-containing protein [Catonella sp.]|uniref:DUF6382 domain-containing protein n=1 Tax=Catonella sp. TaxID=2382125 RepID=UPI003FA07AD2
MEKFNYIQDGGKNYLKSDRISRMDYVTEMLIKNEIPSLAPARFKSLNAENYICYDMNGLISIRQSFEMSKLTAKRAESFLRSIIMVCKGMEEFLLPFNRLIIDETYIYENYGKKEEFYWIYGNDATEGSFTSLFERLLDRVDYKDDRAVKMMYSMYQAAKDSEEIINKDIGGSSLFKIKEKAEEILSAPYKNLDVRAKELIMMENKQAMMEKSVYDRDTEPDIYEENKKMRTDVEKQDLLKGRFNSKKIVKEKAINKEKAIKEKAVKDKQAKGNTMDKKFNMKSKFKQVWDYLNADIGSKPVKEENMPVAVEEEMPYNLREIKSRVVEKREVEYNPTTLLTGAMIGNGIYCLKSEELNDENILLTEFPFFIGKSGEKTNHRIEDSTVSRFHARIDKEEDDLWLTDLNSTNGTFLNGIRMLPYDRVRISRGDSVVISRKRYEVKYMG